MRYLILLIVILQFSLSAKEDDNNNKETFKANIEIKLDSEEDIINALHEIKEDDVKSYDGLIAIRKADKALFKKELRRIYYALLLRKGYQEVRESRTPTIMEKERALKKEIKEIARNHKVEKDQAKQQKMFDEMMKKSEEIITLEMAKDSRYINNLKKRIRVIEGRLESKRKNKKIYAERFVNECIK